MLPPSVPLRQRDGEKSGTSSNTHWSWQIVRTGEQAGIEVRGEQDLEDPVLDPAVCESNLKCSLFTVLPSRPCLVRRRMGSCLAGLSLLCV